MNIYKISQEVNNGYDTYDSAIVVAANEDDARDMHPDGNEESRSSRRKDCQFRPYDWAKSPEQVKVELVGVAAPKLQRSVLCASFNAG